jgi:hypothetical protein
MRKLTAATIVLAGLFVQGVHLRAIASPLSERDVADAVALADRGGARPYVIYMNSQRVEPVAFVYTPFVRVAMAAQAAAAAGRAFDMAALPPDVRSNLIYVAFRWYHVGSSPFNLCVSGDASEQCLRDQTIVANAGVLGSPHGKALWVSRDLSKLTAFGAPVPHPQVAVVAAFNPSDFGPGMLGACVWRGPIVAGAACDGRGAALSAGDLQSWR